MRGMKICAMPDPMPIVSVSGQRAAQPARGVGKAEQIAHHPFGLVQEGATAVGGFDAARGAA